MSERGAKMIRSEKSILKPFWSWNDQLEKKELEYQIEQMKENGIDGFFMHARAGLRTEYLSDEWFDMIETCLDKADELGMQAWAYDENGWPSGFGNGMVTALGIEHQQKSLHYAVYGNENFEKDHILGIFRKKENGFARINEFENGAFVFYYHVNPYYVDVFHKETTRRFLEFTHERYYERFKERFGSSLQGFFTDEPQFCPSPWSFVFPKEFQATYQYDLLDHLPLLFFEEEGFERVRNDFQKLVSKLFAEAYVKVLYDWCEEHQCKLTGHMLGETDLCSQMDYSGGVMPCYEYFHEPGMDHLNRRITSPLQPKQVSSVAMQLGRKTITETFALCGWDVSLNELKWIAQSHYLNGVTSLCSHLEGYSLRGIRKRDYPASLFVQLPWFRHVHSEFADYFSKLGELLDSGEEVAPLLVIHPIHSAYILQNPYDREKLKLYNETFVKIATGLNEEHLLYHYGDETIIEKYGSIVQKEDKILFQIGKCEYQELLLPNIINLAESTVDLLLLFAKQGGKISAIGSLPVLMEGRDSQKLKRLCEAVQLYESLAEFKKAHKVLAPIEIYHCDGNAVAVHVAMKKLPGKRTLIYVTNNEAKEQAVTLKIDGCFLAKSLDVVSAATKSLVTMIEKGTTTIQLNIGKYGSQLLICEECEDSCIVEEEPWETLPLDKEFNIMSQSPNALTLDKCIYRVDGGEWKNEIAVINLQNELLELQRPCEVEMKFSFEIAELFDFETMELCMENPEKYKIFVNEKRYGFVDDGYFIDKSIRKSKIGDFLKEGMNTIRLCCRFHQSPELYFAKFTPGVHESVLNKLTYDTELESIYLLGDFRVNMEENYVLGERRCLHAGKLFSLKKPIHKVMIDDLTHQGFWFFAGEMTLVQEISLKKEENKNYKIVFKELNAPAARIYVNDTFAGNMMFAPFELDVTKLLKDGKNRIAIQLLSGNRNLLGPHHRPLGEVYAVGPSTFTDKAGWADDPKLPTWTDNYNFVLFGIDL